MKTTEIRAEVPPGADGVTISGIAYVRGGPSFTGGLKTYWPAHPDCPRCGRPRGQACQSSWGKGLDQLTPHPERRLPGAGHDGSTLTVVAPRDSASAPLGSAPQARNDGSRRMIDPAPTREAIDRATHTAMLATTGFIGEHRQQLQACTPATRDALLVQFAITYLASNGLISIAGAEQFDGWLALDLEPPFADHMLAAVRKGVEEQGQLNAALR